MKLIPLTQGKFAMVDEEDYPELSQFKWYARKADHIFYAERTITVSRNNRKHLGMHNFLMGPIGKVDHRDGNGLNNQRHNLRPATSKQNGANRRKIVPSSSKFKGVTWLVRNKKWQARIRVSYRLITLGCFQSETDAAHAYDDAALTYFGEFSNLNFPRK